MATKPKAEAAPPAPTVRTAEEQEQMAASSIGAQIILDYNSDAAKGARGGMGATIEENTMARDANLVAVGLDPNAPSGPPTGEPWVPPVDLRVAPAPAEAATPPSGTATRMSSLAAGITADMPGTTPPAGGGAAPVNTALPAVTQAGDTLSCTMGTWDGEPTSYAYAWTIDGASVGTDSATYTVQAADVGKVAACIVTATNVTGSTAAPPSADVTIADPAGATRSRR